MLQGKNGITVWKAPLRDPTIFRTEPKQAFLEVGNGSFCDNKHIKIVKHVNRVEFIVGLKTYNQSNFYLRS